jgi:hypothetical protein
MVIYYAVGVLFVGLIIVRGVFALIDDLKKRKGNDDQSTPTN